MTEERLRAAEGWAGYPDRDPEAARLVCDLVREVRRLQAAAVPPDPFGGWECKVCSARPSTDPDNYGLVEHGKGCYVVDDDGGGQELIDPVTPQEQPAALPPFRGILDGITAETVYGVEV